MTKLYSEFKPYQTWSISSLLFFIFMGTYSGVLKGREIIFNTRIRHGQYDEAIHGVTQGEIIDYAPIGMILISFIAVFICNKKELNKFKRFANHLHWAPVVLIIFYSFMN
ncbi:MAG: hypothetical protein CMH31_01785 [Micavibrio sp.]|nr:hypothetical protein [Micavibrio sp.]|tara:strand:- start:848 stop:1177 length:330 start_codon:yes stop_codon:yes gene_type:complete